MFVGYGRSVNSTEVVQSWGVAIYTVKVPSEIVEVESLCSDSRFRQKLLVSTTRQSTASLHPLSGSSLLRVSSASLLYLEIQNENLQL